MESKSLCDGFVAEGFASAAQVHPKGTNSSVPNTQHRISGGAASRGDKRRKGSCHMLPVKQIKVILLHIGT